MRTITPLCLLLFFCQLQSLAVIDCKITINGTSGNPVCTGPNGTIAISPTGGAAPYRYKWTNGDTTSSIIHLLPGAYTVTVTDRNACAASRTFALTATSRVMTLSARAISDTCAMGRGKATVTVTGNGDAPYRYAWSDNNTGAMITGLGAHYYSVTVTGVNGCSATAGASVSNTGTAIVISGTLTQPVCYTGVGAISIHPGGGTSSIYSVLWSNGSTGYNLTGLQQGSYMVTVSGQNGCSAARSFAIIRPDSINVKFKVSGVKCDSALGGAITETSITGATYPWTASWTGPRGFTSNSVNINRLAGGQYRLSFMDALGCTATGNYTVDSSGAVNVNYGVSNIYCSQNNGAISFQTLSPYSSMATYNWNASNGFTSANKSISGLRAGNYSVTLSEDFGCKAVRNYTLTSMFDVGVASIKNMNSPAPGQEILVHPIAGDMSQVNGNHCAAGISGQVQLTVTGQAHYLGVTQGALIPSTINGNTLTWNVADFGNLKMDSSFFIILKTDTLALLGTQICVTVTVTPLSGDNNPSNNTANICLMVVRPYDPNQKQVFPEGDIDVTQKTLTYTVMFQNIGTAAAQNVFILDTLDLHTDAGSFKVLGSSHTMQVSQTGNDVRFNFAGINLPDSGVDEAGSRGWVQYSVNLRDSLSVGTEIDNTAFIYFDFNSPVVTNTTVNHVGSGVSTGISSNMQIDRSNIYLYPNPAHNSVFVKVENEAVGGKLEITDAVGRKCGSFPILNNVLDLKVNNLVQGMYLINVIKASGAVATKKMMVE